MEPLRAAPPKSTSSLDSSLRGSPAQALRLQKPETDLPDAPSQKYTQRCVYSMRWSNETRKSGQGERNKGHLQAVKKKKASDRHCNRLEEPGPRWEEGLEGSGKRPTVEPGRFECAWGDSTVLSGLTTGAQKTRQRGKNGDHCQLWKTPKLHKKGIKWIPLTVLTMFYFWSTCLQGWIYTTEKVLFKVWTIQGH